MRSSARRPLTADEAARLPWPLRVVRAILHPRDEWLLLGLGSFLFVIGANTQTGWLYVVDACILALLFIGWVLPRVTIRHLRVHRDCTPSATEGETVPVRITVTNPQASPRYMVTLCDTPVAARGEAAQARRFLVPEVPAHSSVSVEYSMPCRHRGAWRFGDIEVRSASPVGFFPFLRRVPSPLAQEIVVCPRRAPLVKGDACSLSLRLATNHRTFNRAGHSYDFHGIREYQPGDDTRHLHWPTSARAGRLMVREFREVGAETVTVLVDTSEGPWTPFEGEGHDTVLDHGARLAASLAHQAHGRSAGVVLVARDASGVDVRTNPRTGVALEWLARLQSHGAVSWPEVLSEAEAFIPRLGNLYVITARTDVDFEVVRLLVERGVLVTVYLLDAAALVGYAGEAGAVTCDEAAHRIRLHGGVVRLVRSREETGRPMDAAPEGAIR